MGSEITDTGDKTLIFGFEPLTVCIVAGIILILVSILALLLVLIRKRRRRKPESIGLKAMNFQGMGKRENQEDSFGVTNVRNTRKGTLAVVADGMGGIANGAELSAIVVSAALRHFEAASEDADISALLLYMATQAQRDARDFIQAHGDEISGSTMIAAIVKDQLLYFVSIGDSHIYLLRGGALVQLNRDHTVATRLDEQAARGEISLSQARNDPNRNGLTSFIGIDELELIDRTLKPIRLSEGDRVMLMTDGVFGTLSDEEIAAAMSGTDFYAAATHLEDAVRAKDKQHQDNFTAIVLEA